MQKFKYITPPEDFGQVIFRSLSAIIVRQLAKAKITPNQVTIFRGIVVIFSLYFFSEGDPVSLLCGVLLFYVFEVLDHVDGDLARFTGKLSKKGSMLEQFIDTWAARPSNILGICFAIGIYRYEESKIGFMLYGVTALGRLLWLEYRDYFGWNRFENSQNKQYRSVLDVQSLSDALRNLLFVLYTWNNAFLLLGAGLNILLPSVFGFSPLIIGFSVVSVLNNVPWIVIVYKGFTECKENITEKRVITPLKGISVVSQDTVIPQSRR